MYKIYILTIASPVQTWCSYAFQFGMPSTRFAKNLFQGSEKKLSEVPLLVHSKHQRLPKSQSKYSQED